MRYRIRGHGVIRSENAAKPRSQKSKFVVDLISNLRPVSVTLDYGAGKLRYLRNLQKKTDQLLVSDSLPQLTRLQIIEGSTRSITNFASFKNSLSVLTTKEVNVLRNQVDRAFLFNVLQIVPIPTIRLAIAKRIYRALKDGGELIASVQYRNSDFSRMAKMQNAHKFRDGIIINHIRGTSFYAFITPVCFQKIIIEAGFNIEKMSLYEGSCYIWAKKIDNYKVVIEDSLNLVEINKKATAVLSIE